MNPVRAFVILSIIASTAAVAHAAGDVDFSGMTPDYTVDVCVVGGGPAGTAAAIAAARNGAHTLLVEQLGFLGGTGTAASVNVFMPYRYIGGVFRDVLHRLDVLNARRGPTYDANLMQVALDQLTAEAGVKVLLYTRAIACTTAAGRPWQGKQRRTITGLVIHNKSGLQMVRAAVYVDCTGDADLAAWAGVPYQIGRETDQVTQPMTMIFRMGGCTFKGGSLMDFPGMQDYWASYAWNPNPGEITLNMTRIKGFSGLSGEDLSAATIQGRQAVLEAVEALKKNVPGFENAYLLAMPAQIGVRETRHVVGATTLTGEQIINPRNTYAHRRDVIARNDYPVDIHDPAGTKAKIVNLRRPYEIPYRCLLPRGVDNLLVAGRPVSADHVASSSLRVQAPCWAMGQAAGTAAALAVKHGVGPWEVGQGDDPAQGQPLLDELQRLLIQQGADLGPRRASELGLLAEWQRWQRKYRLEAFPMPRDFEDVPAGHPAHDAVVGLVRMGVFRGVSETRFDANGPATLGAAVAVIARAHAVLPTAEEAPEPAELPANLQGQWWSAGLAECVARGAYPVEELPAFRADFPLGADAARSMLMAAFPACQSLPELPEGLGTSQQLTRAGLAFWLWACLESLAGP